MPPAPPCWRCGRENHYGGPCPGDPMVQHIASLEAENAKLREALAAVLVADHYPEIDEIARTALQKDEDGEGKFSL